MRLVVNTKVFQDELRKVMLASSTKTDVIPALNCIKFEANWDGTIKMTSYNLSIAVESVIDEIKTEEGVACINAKKLSEIVQKCKSDTIDIFVNESGVCTVKCGNAVFNMQTVEYDTFPSLPNVNETSDIEVDFNGLIDAAGAVSYAVSLSETKPIMQGVCFKFSDGIVDVVASDGYRLSKRTVKTTSKREFSIVVPSNTVSVMSRILKDSSERASITASRNFIIFSVGNRKITSRLLSGEYFDWKSVIPSDFVSNCKFNRKDLIDSLEMAMTFAITTKGVNSPVRISFEKQNANIYLKSATGTFEDNVAYQCDQNALVSIGFNPCFLIDAIKACQEEQIIIKIKGNLSPCVICGVNSCENFDLVLPVRIKNE